MIAVTITILGTGETFALGDLSRAPDLLDQIDDVRGVLRVVQRRWSADMASVQLSCELMAIASVEVP